jgi:hypothetical protein
VDMHTYRQKGVVRVQVGVLNRDHFPYTTYLVFGRKGYNITFAEESADFAPVLTPFEDHRSKDGVENGSGGGNPNDDNSRDKDKKKKMTAVQRSTSLPVPQVLHQCRLRSLRSLRV